MSVNELRVRSRQQLAQLYERVFRSGAEMSDQTLLAEICPWARNGSSDAAARRIIERLRRAASSPDYCRPTHSFFPSLTHRSEIAAGIEKSFAVEERALIDRAERAIEGRFDLLGFSDLAFGDPVDWHLEPISGKRAPLAHWSKIPFLDPGIAGDKKITWELNRHGHFVTLGQVFYVTGDERFAEAFVAQASSWMDANPPGLGINWASSLELALRSISWLWALHLFADSRHVTPEFAGRLLKCLVMHGRHIETHLSYYFSPNTHLTGEALGLFYLGVALPELRRARQWLSTGLRILVDQLVLQVRADGVYFEQTSYYHRYTTDFYIHLVILARACGLSLPGEVEERLKLLLDHLMWITRPDGTSPLLGDDDGGRLVALGDRKADDFRDTLAVGAALFGRGDWKKVAGETPVEMLWLLGPSALAGYRKIKACAPHEKNRSFSDGGYIVMRDGWSSNSSYVLINCGPEGAVASAHAHSDALAIELAANGMTWIVDPGTYTYTGNAGLRDWFRSTRAHSTASVDDQDQSISAGPFKWSQTPTTSVEYFVPGDSVVYFKASHDGYERLGDPVKHTRTVLFMKVDLQRRHASEPASLLVKDSFSARGRHHYAMRYQLSSGCRGVATGNRVTVTEPGDRELSIICLGRTIPRARVEQGWVSRCYGRREEAPVVVFETEGDGSQEFVTLITPSEKGV